MDTVKRKACADNLRVFLPDLAPVNIENDGKDKDKRPIEIENIEPAQAPISTELLDKLKDEVIHSIDVVFPSLFAVLHPEVAVLQILMLRVVLQV